MRISLFALSACVTAGTGQGSTECICSSSSSSSSSTPPTLANNRDARFVAIKNSCSFDLDIGFTGGFAGSSGPCEKNQVEDTSSGRCFWNLWGDGDTELSTFYLESGRELATAIEHGDHNGTVIFSGNVWGTRRLEDACPEDSCNAWTGPIGGLTKAEFTFLAGNESADFIDVSLVDGGASLPVSMRPEGFEKSGLENAKFEFPGDCAWEFNPGEKNQFLVEVADAHGSCDEHDDCFGHDVCGVSFSDDQPRYGTCGKHVGWSNALANCMQGSTSPEFECDKYFDVYACRGEWGGSGYTPGLGAAPHVCGCTSYPDIGGLSHAFPCVNHDRVWEEVALPWIRYLKKGCPSTFTYPYDDSANSLFTFRATSYIIEMCPGESEKTFFLS